GKSFRIWRLSPWMISGCIGSPNQSAGRSTHRTPPGGGEVVPDERTGPMDCRVSCPRATGTTERPSGCRAGVTLATHRLRAWRPVPFAGGRGDLAETLQPPGREYVRVKADGSLQKKNPLRRGRLR